MLTQEIYDKVKHMTASSWENETFVAIDLETTGAYPIGSSICEIGALVWENNKLKEKFQALVKPPRPMSEEVIKIHNITNEMVETAPPLSQILPDFLEFIKTHTLVAHHAPFDLGFLAYECEKQGLALPNDQVILCSSLLSRKLILEVPNHRLQTLVQHFKFESQAAHRAFEDAKNSLYVLLECLNRLGKDKSLQDVLILQEKKLSWQMFSIKALNLNPQLIEAIQKEKNFSLIYKGTKRDMSPLGVVRNPDGDFLAGRTSQSDKYAKRFYFNKISFL